MLDTSCFAYVERGAGLQSCYVRLMIDAKQAAAKESVHVMLFRVRKKIKNKKNKFSEAELKVLVD